MRFLGNVTGLHLAAPLDSFCCALAIVCLAWCGGSRPATAAQATVTALSLTSGGSAVSSLAGGTIVSLTATVQADAATLTLGQVNFCDATAASCTDIHLLGTAQLTSAGTAVLRLRPGPGNHSYKAAFLGSLAGAPSASAPVALTMSTRPPGLQTTFTVASVTGPDATSMYTLAANVGTKGAITPSGTISFLNTNNANSLLGTATLVGGGNGFLNVPIPEPASGGADALPIVAVGDFNGDGIPDIVSAPHGGIAISLGKGDGTFMTPLIPNVDSGDGINAFGVGDFNDDGNSDLLVDDEDTGKLTVLLGKGDGTFTVGQIMPFNTQSIAIADFNGDGKLDLALSGSAQISILLGNGDGTFSAAPNPPQIGSSQAVTADFNGDGKIDLAVSISNNATAILLGNGDGTFTAAPNQAQISASQLVAADFNNDGKIDLAASAPDGTISILLGNGDGTFTAASTFPAGSNAPSLAVGDFNGDGKPDIAVAGVANFPDHQVTIFTGNSDGTFAIGTNINVPSVQSLAVADFTGSGSSDVSTFGSVILGNLAISTVTNSIDLPTGFAVIQADYPGDANNAPSSSTNAPSILVPQQPISLSSQPVILTPGTSATGNLSVTSSGFTGTLDLTCSIPGPNDEQPSSLSCSAPATVNFLSAGSTVNLTYTVTAQATTANGQYSALIMATYPPGGVPPASTVAVVTVNVPPPNVPPAPPPGFTLSSTAINIAMPGPSGTSTITISPSGGFTGSVSLSCAVSGVPMGGADAPTCSVTAPPAITGDMAVAGTLTVSTTAPSSTANRNSVARNQHPPRGLAIGGRVVTMASLLLFGFPILRRRVMAQLHLLLIASLIGLTTGCGGATKAATPPATPGTPPANPGTTPGTYIVTVTGSSGSIIATTVVSVTVN